MKKLIVTTFAALSAGATFANIASVDEYMEVNWFENAITSTFPEGWSGTDGQATIADNKMTIDAETAVTFTPPKKTGTVVSQVFDIDPEPVSELPKVASDVQTGLVVLEESDGLAFYAYARTTADGTAAWLKLSGTPSEDGQKIAIEADYETTPAKLKFLLVDDNGETALNTSDLFAANSATTVTAYDFTGTGTLASLTGTQTADTAAIVNGQKYGTLAEALTAAVDPTTVQLIAEGLTLPDAYGDYKIVDGKIVAKVYVLQIGETKLEAADVTAEKIIAALTAETPVAVTVLAQSFELPEGCEDYKIVENAVVARVYVAQVGETKYEDLAAALTAAGEDPTQVVLIDKTITELPEGYEDYVIEDGVIVAATAPAPTANVATLDAKAQTDLEGNPVALDAAFKFTTVEPSEKTLEKYGDWEANFEVSFNQDIAEGSVALKGTYEGFGQVFDWQEMPMTGDLAKDAVWTLLPEGQVTFADVLKIGTFTCGLKNLSDDNTDAQVTVKLVLKKEGEQTIVVTTTTNDLIETEALDSAVASELIAAGKTTVKLAAGATFTYDQVPEEAQAITIKTEGTVKVVGDAETKPVVDNISVVGGGALAFENVTKEFTAIPTDAERELLQNEKAWKNCVAVIKNVTTTPAGGAKIHECGNATSSVVIDSSKFWLYRPVGGGDMPKVTFPVEIAGTGFIVDGTSAAKYPFAKVTGAGTITFKGGNAAALVIEDASEFTGSIDANKAVYLNATVGDTTATGKIVIPAETEMKVAAGKTYTAETIEVNGTLTAMADQLKATSITGTGLVDLSSKNYVDAELTVLEKMTSTLTAKVNNFKGYFSGGVAGDNYVVNVPPTIEILGTFEVSGGYTRTPNWKGVISKIKGDKDAVFKVSINVGGRCDIEIGNLDDYAGTLALANNSWLILPNGDVTVDGAKAKFADATKSTYTTNANDAIAAAQTGTTATGVTIFDATGVTVPDGYALAADGTLTRKLYYKEMTNTGKATDWYNVAGIKFADVNGAEMTYTEGDTIIINKSLVAYMHDGMDGAKLAVEGENTVQIIRSGDGSGADYALKGVALTIGEDATVVVPCCEVNGWNSYATSKPAQSELNGVTIDGAGTLVVPTRTDKSATSAPAKVVLTNTTIADTVTVTLDEGSTIVVDANSSMPKPTVGTTTTTGAKLLTSTEGGVTTYTVGVEQGEEWTDVPETTPISDIVPAAQAAALEAAGATTKAITTWAAEHAAGTKPGDELNLAAFALNLDNDATPAEIEAAAEDLTVTIEMVDGVAKASVVLKNGLTVNVEPVMKGKVNLTDAEWSKDLTGKKFFKAFIDL